jgi:DNA-binding GntR family transcriptional regulator
VLTIHPEKRGRHAHQEDVIACPASEASTRFAWAAPGTPLVEITRILYLDDDPVAIAIDEVPQLPALGESVRLQARSR